MNLLQVLTQSNNPLCVIEQSAVPEVMKATRVVMEVAPIGSIELIQSVHSVFRGMAVYHIEKNHKPHTVCCVY